MSQERDMIGMDQGPIEMMERYCIQNKFLITYLIIINNNVKLIYNKYDIIGIRI